MASTAPPAPLLATSSLTLFSDLTVAQAAVRPRRNAAGVLVHLVDKKGVDWYLLGKRSKRLGGTWANIGGSQDGDETPLACALRELWEETGIPARVIAGHAIRRVVESRMAGSEAVYTLFVVDVPAAFEKAANRHVDPDRSEVSELAWWRADAIDDLKLHSGFAEQWRVLR